MNSREMVTRGETPPRTESGEGPGPGKAASCDPEGFRRDLLDHFDRLRRPLPWRSERTPYRVLVSEFMLQQTRAETVIPYYDRWLRRFPGWEALANASRDEVILEWKGLGYYRRARNLHRTARMVRERFNGRLPEDPAKLRTLPGVGDYTAGAVASIAFGIPVPAVDGNVKRVLSRLMDVGDPTTTLLRHEAARLLDPGRPGDFNEAMMELGATVCTPRSPRCNDCPVSAHCLARAAGTVAKRPAARPRRQLPRVEYVTAVAVREARPLGAPALRPGAPPHGSGSPRPPGSRVHPSARATLLVRRPDTGLLAGMWEFPTTESRPTERALTSAALELLATFGLSGAATHHPAPVKHTFSHFHATYHPVIVRCESHDPDPAPLPPGATWTDPARLDDFALPVAQQKIGALLGSPQLSRWLRGSPRRESG